MFKLNEKEISKLIELGEDSKTQFKQNIHSPDKLAQEMIAFSNASGGKILIGIQDNGQIRGISTKDIHRLNQMVSNVSTNNIEIYVDETPVDGTSIEDIDLNNFQKI